MARILLVHWNAEEAAARAARLRAAGHRVDVHADTDATALRAMRAAPPDAFVVDLGRLPSHGQAVGVWLRQQKATRHLPLVFVGGVAAKVARVRAQLPDAVYTEWRRIRGSLRAALARAPAAPVVPATMAGYSGTPLPKKLGIRSGTRVLLLDAPPDFSTTLGDLPEGVELRRQARGPAPVILLFVKSQAALVRRFPVAVRALADRGALWIVWPKQSSSLARDLTQTVVRRHGLGAGLVDYKVCAVDATWSGLCFARRR